jgi:hypothetical protein
MAEAHAVPFWRIRCGRRTGRRAAFALLIVYRKTF